MNKKRAFSVAFVVCLSALLLACCSFFAPLKLNKPFLIHNSSQKCISWSVVDNAKLYEVFVNDRKEQEIKQPETGNDLTFDYSELFNENGLYVVKVRAVGDGERYTQSAFSNEIRILVGEQGEVGSVDDDLFKDNVVEGSEKAPQNLNVTTNMLSWSQCDEAIGYVVGVYCNSLGLKYYTISTNYLELLPYCNGETAFVRVGSLYENDVNTYFSEGEFYNSVSKNEFTQKYYMFDGGVYDFYIEDYSELQNLYYFAFVSRLEEYSFLVADSFASVFESSYANNNSIIRSCFRETYAYENIPTIKQMSQEDARLEGLSENGYTITCKFSTKQPTLVNGYGISTVSRQQYQTFTPYYEMVDYESRSNNYDDFDSDKNFLYTTVSSSDELFWAVQEGFTPRFPTGVKTRAEIIYKNAKDVLNSIIKVGMTDYEKVLSIFDWIMYNTRYDKYAQEQGQLSNSDPTVYTCYYLEGVFMDANKLSVCDGFSKAFSLMCNMEGIDCVRITGQASNQGHAWNKVKLNGNWYTVDVTWSEVLESESSLAEIAVHTYFLRDFTDMQSTHEEFSGRDKYNLYSNDGYMCYYKNTKFTYNGKQYDLFIESDEDLNAVLFYCYERQFKSLEIMLDPSYEAQISSDIVDVLIDNKPVYGTMKAPKMLESVPYDYTIKQNIFTSWRQVETSDVMYLEFGYFIKNATSLNDLCKMLAETNATKLDTLDICIDEDFVSGLQGYDANLDYAENFENIINDNYYFIKNNLQISLTIIKENQTADYTLANGQTATYTFNIYSVEISQVDEQQQVA